MLETKSPTAREQDSLFIWITRPFTGFLNDRLRVRLAPMGASSMRWSKPASTCEDFDTSSAWWEFELTSLHMCLATTNQYLPTLRIQVPSLRRRLQPSLITLCARDVVETSGERRTSIRMRTLPICWQSRSPTSINAGDSLRRCFYGLRRRDTTSMRHNVLHYREVAPCNRHLYGFPEHARHFWPSRRTGVR